MYLTIEEVCAQLRVSRWTVRRRIQDGELEAIKGPGAKGHVKISEASLQRYIERQTVMPADSGTAAS